MSTSQTWLPYPDYEDSARVLDDKRLGDQRVHALQIFQALSCRRLQATTTVLGPRGGHKKVDLPRDQWTIENASVGWAGSPATRMWEGALFDLLEYQTAICAEWVERGYVDTCLDKTEFLFLEIVDWMYTGGTPRWYGNDAFHASHRAALLAKNPDWYEKWGWDESPDLNLIWP